MLTSLLSAKAAAAAVAALALGGAAGAAYAGALPAPAQQFAHHMIGAPSPASSHGSGGQPTATPVGPDATGPAAFGLCTAYAHAMAHGTAAQKSVAFRNLAAAAQGQANIAAYCATVPHPGAPHAGQPTSPPSHASGPPASHPTGRPTSLPAHPTGRPTSAPSHP